MHMYAHLNNDISICLEADMLMQFEARALTCFDDPVEMQRWLDCKMYVY